MFSADNLLSSISNKELADTIRSLLLLDPPAASKKLRQNFLFDEAIAVSEGFEVEKKYQQSSIKDYQRTLWEAPTPELEIEIEIQESPIVFECQLEAGISKPMLLRSANGAWFIWKHEEESDWAINNLAEVAASIIDRSLNLQVVPYTFPFDRNGRKGISQLWLHGTEMVFLNFPKCVDHISSGKIRLLDYLIFNRDRRSTNLLVEKNMYFKQTSAPLRLFAIDHGGAFYKRRLDDGTYEQRPPEEVLSFVGARSIEELFPIDTMKDGVLSLDSHYPFPALEKYLSDFDLAGIAERVSWLQNRI